MSVAVRLVAFAIAVAAAFGIGFGVGDVAGPFGGAPPHVMAPGGDPGGSVHDRHAGDGTEDDR